jgi:hypothetical protein
MKNMLRWALCQTFGKAKGVALYDALSSGLLGDVIRNTEEKALAGLLGRIGSQAVAMRLDDVIDTPLRGAQ